MLKNCEN